MLNLIYLSFFLWPTNFLFFFRIAVCEKSKQKEYTNCDRYCLPSLQKAMPCSVSWGQKSFNFTFFQQQFRQKFAPVQARFPRMFSSRVLITFKCNFVHWLPHFIYSKHCIEEAQLKQQYFLTGLRKKIYYHLGGPENLWKNDRTHGNQLFLQL